MEKQQKFLDCSSSMSSLLLCIYAFHSVTLFFLLCLCRVMCKVRCSSFISFKAFLCETLKPPNPHDICNASVMIHISLSLSICPSTSFFAFLDVPSTFSPNLCVSLPSVTLYTPPSLSISSLFTLISSFSLYSPSSLFALLPSRHNFLTPSLSEVFY